MTALGLAVAAVCWIACGVLAYGITLADFQRGPLGSDADYRGDRAVALFFGVLGPSGALASFLLSNFARHGLMYRRRRP